MTCYIFAGRFQPFHIGHLQVANELCQISQPNDTIVLGVVANVGTRTLMQDSVIKIKALADEQHLPERNPWSVSVRLNAIALCADYLRQKYQQPLIVSTTIPRPEYFFEDICLWFDDRVWVVPECGEEFDKEKAAFFLSKGEEVIRIPDMSGVSGWDIRRLFENGNHVDLLSSIPAFLRDVYIRGWRQ